MDAANLQLSTEEMRLVMDPGIILTKNSIIGKVVELFAALSEEYRAVWEGVTGDAPGRIGGNASGRISGDAPMPSPKISKGENYRGLPYVMLDYPRLFGREDVLAIRTMFWWGHAFSVTLHLKGAYHDLYLPVLQQRWSALAAAGFHTGVSEDEWRHEFVPDNYQPLVSAEDLGAETVFLKLSAAVGLHRWEEAPDVLARWFRVLVDVLHG